MEKIHQRSLTIMLLWVSSLVVISYMFSYRFIDVHIVPRWLSFTLLYAYHLPSILIRFALFL